MPALDGELLCSQAAIEPLIFYDHSFQCVRTVLILLLFLTYHYSFKLQLLLTVFADKLYIILIKRLYNPFTTRIW